MCTVVNDGWLSPYANSPSNVTMENIFIYHKANSNHRQGPGACCQLNSHVKYPASSSYHLTRLVLVKTSSPLTFTVFLTLATARRYSFATGGTFSISSSQLRSLPCYSPETREKAILTQMGCAGSAWFDSDMSCPRVTPRAVFKNTWSSAP